jgi:hypothetical protein
LATFRQKSTKIAHFSLGLTGLSFTADEIRSLVVLVIFGIFRQNSSEISHFSFDRMGLSFAVDEVRSLAALGYFRVFSSKIGHFIFGLTGQNHQQEPILVLIGRVNRLP